MEDTFDQDLEYVPNGEIILNDNRVVKNLLCIDDHHPNFVSGQIDNLTLTFNIPVNNFDLYRSKLLMFKNENYHIRTDNSFTVTYSHAFFECNIAQNTAVRNNARLDFNPTLVTKELSDFIVTVILKDCSNLKKTRVDIALDYSVDLSVYSVEPKNGLKKRIYTDSRGVLETLYLGSKQRLFRLYNKKKERLDKESVVIGLEHLWRIEVQARNQYLDNLKGVFDCFYLKNMNFDDLDLSKVSNKVYKDIYFYLHAESAANYFSNNQLANIKTVISDCFCNPDIKIDNDYQLIFEQLDLSIRKYGVKL